jgi:hypothetical protein
VYLRKINDSKKYFLNQLILTKYGLGYILGDLKKSGHPGPTVSVKRVET